MIADVKPFDASRAMLEDYLNGYPARLDVTEAHSIQTALDTQLIAPDTRVLTFEYEQGMYAFPMAVVLSYNVIQGEINGKAWMMTFCNACNGGMVFDPVVDGKTLHFQRRGAYDGLLLIWDEETNSYWQHITGQALYGSSQGKQLNLITSTRQMTAAEAAAANANTRLLTSTLTPEQEKLSRAMEKMRANPERLESGIISTVVQEDTRRPRFELGLGIWTEQTSIFFPLMMLYANENVLQTEFDGRKVLIYHPPEAVSPTAVYMDTRRAVWEGETLRLDKGAYIQNDQYFDGEGKPQTLERPMQLLMRWYGFAMTFPGCALPQAA